MSLRPRSLALLDVMERYRDAIVYQWQQRNAASHRSYTAGEAEFLPAALALIEKPVSPTARLTGLLLVSLVACAILWAMLARATSS
jgi:hemolysin D